MTDDKKTVDKNGRALEPGDIVLVPCRVQALCFEGSTDTVILHTLQPNPINSNPSELQLAASQVAKEGPPPTDTEAKAKEQSAGTPSAN